MGDEMNEDGINNGARSFGKLCLMLIPWALGIGASVWLGVWIGVHQFRHELSQEERRNIEVGAQVLPKQKINLQLNKPSNSCRKIEKADFDDGVLVVYFRNTCQSASDYDMIGWNALAPDGTIISSAEHYTNMLIGGGQRAEWHTESWMAVPSDERIVTLQVWVKAGH